MPIIREAMTVTVGLEVSFAHRDSGWREARKKSYHPAPSDSGIATVIYCLQSVTSGTGH